MIPGMSLIAELPLIKRAVPSMFPSPEFLANPLALDFEGFDGQMDGAKRKPSRTFQTRLALISWTE
jgi:hypothetical protein